MPGRPTKAPRSGRAASPILYGREDDIALIEGLIDRVRDGGAAGSSAANPESENRRCWRSHRISRVPAACACCGCAA